MPLNRLQPARAGHVGGAPMDAANQLGVSPSMRRSTTDPGTSCSWKIRMVAGSCSALLQAVVLCTAPLRKARQLRLLHQYDRSQRRHNPHACKCDHRMTWPVPLAQPAAARAKDAPGLAQPCYRVLTCWLSYGSASATPCRARCLGSNVSGNCRHPVRQERESIDLQAADHV